MLPHEIFTLVLLCTRALAIPQGSPTEQNATITSYPFTEHSQEKVHLENTAPGWEDTIQPTGEQSITWDPCAPNGCHELTVHLESSQTSWLSLATSIAQGHSNTPQSTQILKQELVPTHAPSLVGLRTEIQPSPQHSIAGPKETPDASPPFANLTPAPASPQEPPANPLLQEIISKLGIHPPSPPSVPTQTPEPNHASPATEITTEGDVTVPPPQVTHINAPSSQTPSGTRITSPPQIMFGSKTLTLTPGLSSLLNVPPSATYIALATNGLGQTLLTVSAGGTAVTATIAGVSGGMREEASATAGVRTGDRDRDRNGDRDGDRDVVMTRSRGVAGRREVGGWIGWGVVLGVVMG